MVRGRLKAIQLAPAGGDIGHVLESLIMPELRSGTDSNNYPIPVVLFSAERGLTGAMHSRWHRI